MADRPHPGETKPPTPRWVRIVGIIVALVVAVIVVVALVGGGEHGPRRHLPGDEDRGGHSPPVQHSP